MMWSKPNKKSVVTDEKRNHSDIDSAISDRDSTEVSPDVPKAQDDESFTLPASKRYAIIGALDIVVLMVALDSTIVSTAIPRITDEFHTVVDVGWYGAAYLICNSTLQPLSGKIYSYFDLNLSYLVFVAIFEIGSIVCATAKSSAILVIGRAICGIGGSGLTNGAMNMIAVAVPPHKRPMMMGLLMAVLGGGQILGPLLGGVFTEHTSASWRWCFWINLPLGACAALALFLVRVQNPNKKQGLTTKTFFKSFDLTGFAIFAPACVMLLLALQWGGVKFAWNSSTIIGLLCGSVAAFAIFVVWEHKAGDNAMFPGSIMGRQVVWSSCVTSILLVGALFILGYYLPLWFQAVKQDSPTMSAVSTLPTFVSTILAAIASGALVTKVGYFTPFAIFGGALSSIGAGLMSTFMPTTSIGQWIGFQVLAGVGRGLAMQQPLSAVQASLTGAEMSTGMAIIAWSQFFGGAVFVAFGQTVLSNVLNTSLQQYVPGIDPVAVINAGATDYLSLASNDAQRQGLILAYNKAIGHTFYLSCAAAALGTFTALGMGWKKVPKKQIKPASSDSKA